jgi:S-methylmethionine-dependent homocysteine/selenocysteine methylase
MKKDKDFLFDEDRGQQNQRSSYQTKSRKSTNLTKKDDINNSISNQQEKLSNYISVNCFRLNQEKQLVNSFSQQIQNCLDVIVIPGSFFKYDKQLWVWILQASDNILEKYLRSILEELSGKALSDRKIKVLKNK